MRSKRKDTMRNIKNANGEILTDDGEVMSRWKEYFKELLGGEPRTSVSTITKPDTIENYITMKELTEAIRTLLYQKMLYQKSGKKHM